LSNAAGEWIGVFRLHNTDYFEKKGLDPVKKSLEVQLIVIAEGSVPNGLELVDSFVDECYMEERPKDGPKYEFVSVLWISWDGAVAKREALGRVANVFQEEHGPKMLDVVLG